MFKPLIDFIRESYQTDEFIPLHAPVFRGNEKKYVCETIESTFVSSVGSFVTEFEEKIANYTDAKYAIATVNGTSALHTALSLLGVQKGTEVITQSLTFVASANAISYCGASPVFVDVSTKTLGLCPQSLQHFLEHSVEVRGNSAWNKKTNRKISACLPMHTFGFPVELDEIIALCEHYHIPVIEDAAESLGSVYKNKHTGTLATLGILSFNGNKVMTTGGGGMILTNDEKLAKRAKHLTTTAKVPHDYEFIHDEIAFNYRMPNLNAALGVAQLESLPFFLESKRALAQSYLEWGEKNGFHFIKEPAHTSANYWLNALLLETKKERDELLKIAKDEKVMMRPLWQPMHTLTMYKECCRVDLSNTESLYQRVVNVPSSVVMS